MGQLTSKSFHNRVGEGVSKPLSRSLLTKTEKECPRTGLNADNIVNSFRSLLETCTPPWIEFERHCYHVIDRPTKNWEDAQNKCHTLNAQLSIITSEEENEFIFQLAQRKRTPRVHLWLGLRRTVNDTFHWVDETPSTQYMNWIPGEPNNHSGNEDCVEMLIGKYWSQHWNDIRCTLRSFQPIFICEKPLL